MQPENGRNGEQNKLFTKPLLSGKIGVTPPESNIASENRWFEDETSFREGLSSGAMLVFG